MSWWRLDEAVLAIHEGLGPLWTVVAVLVLVVAARARLTTALGVAILLLILSQSWFTPVLVLGKWLRWWVLLLVCVRGVLAARRVPRPAWESNATRALPFLLGALAIASVLWSDSRTYTVGIAASFAISLVASFWVLWRLFDTEEAALSACRGAVWLALGVFGAGFVCALAADGTDDLDILAKTNWGGRFSGILWNANMSGLLAMLSIPAMVAAPRRRLGLAASFRWLAIVLAAAALFLSGSRSALVGTCLALLILFLYRFGFGAALTIALGTAGVAVVLATGSFEDVESAELSRFARTKHIRTLSGRVDLWEEGLDAVEGNMLLGLGWGHSRLLHGADAEESFSQGGVRGASNLHSTHVQVLVDVGFVGLAILWTLCLQVLWAGWRLLLMPRDERSVVHVMVLACFVATLADTFVHGSVLSTGSPSALLFWSCAAILLKEAEQARAVAAGWAPERTVPDDEGTLPAVPETA